MIIIIIIIMIIIIMMRKIRMIMIYITTTIYILIFRPSLSRPYITVCFPRVNGFFQRPFLLASNTQIGMGIGQMINLINIKSDSTFAINEYPSPNKGYHFRELINQYHAARVLNASKYKSNDVKSTTPRNISHHKKIY